MTAYAVIDRPPRNRRALGEPGDEELEQQLLETLDTGRAICVPLAFFHTSPAKGRLWKRGYRVLHRVLADRKTVGAWVEIDPKVMTALADALARRMPVIR
jgi:hypothetical protein